MEARLLPTASWCWAHARTGYRVPPPSPHTMHDRWFQALVLAGWLAGVPCLALGIGLESPALVGIGASALFAATLFATLNHARVVAPAFTWSEDASQAWSVAHLN